MPTPVNAKEISKINDVSKYSYRDLTIDLDILEAQIVSHDKESLKVAMRLYKEKQLDGSAAEIVQEHISKIIRSNPFLYLSSLKEINAKSCYGSTSLSLGFVDRAQAQYYEIKERMEAISSINDSELMIYKEKCVGLLKSFLEEIKMLEKLTPNLEPAQDTISPHRPQAAN